MKYLLWLTLLLVAGCSENRIRDRLHVQEGINVTCDWCIGLELRDVEEMKTEGHEDSREVEAPKKP